MCRKPAVQTRPSQTASRLLLQSGSGRQTRRPRRWTLMSQLTRPPDSPLQRTTESVRPSDHRKSVRPSDHGKTESDRSSDHGKTESDRPSDHRKSAFRSRKDRVGQVFRPQEVGQAFRSRQVGQPSDHGKAEKVRPSDHGKSDSLQITGRQSGQSTLRNTFGPCYPTKYI